MMLWGRVKLCWKMFWCMFKECNQKLSHISQESRINQEIKKMCMHVKACLEIFCYFFNKLFSRHFPDSKANSRLLTDFPDFNWQTGSFQQTNVFETGLLDHHKLVTTIMKVKFT